MTSRLARIIGPALASLAVIGACSSTPAIDSTARFDGGAQDARPEAATDAGPDGPPTDPTLGDPCGDDSQCGDGLDCTFDRCDRTLSPPRCRNTPDDSQCADTLYCNGRERCVPRLGCRAGEPVTCQDGDSCTIDACVESTKACVRMPRDLDGDGEADDHCAGGTDCDDLDPNVGARRTEVCGNGRDDNCSRRVDEAPCSVPADDTCATARTVTAPALVALSTAATRRDFFTSCSVATPTAARDVVVAVVVPGAPTDPPQDLEVFATSAPGAASADTAVAILSSCVPAGAELACGHAPLSSQARARARSVRPGTYYVVVTTQNETTVELSVELSAPTPPPPNESCAAPLAVATDTPFTVSLVDAARDLTSACESATGELTYAFTLTEPRDVRVVSARLRGAGLPVVSLREPGACTNELRCRVGPTPPLLARSLPAGTHVLAVAGSAALDANVIVQTLPPTVAPPSTTCAAPPALTHDATVTVDLSGYDEIPSGCLPGGPTAAFALTLAQPSDVLLVGRFPTTEQGAVSLSAVGCTKADSLACQRDTTPARVAKRNVPAGTYRALLHDERGERASLGAFVRPTVPPTAVVADGCADAYGIPLAGGFFTGDTSARTPDFSASCDGVGGPAAGAGDQLLKLTLPDRRRVLLDMAGSSYATLLNVREGAACPGTE
ncbi:MAG TPA: hypothetical protein PK141_23100, partial [Polyangiaceae bacterium]|nr:hypothetical protein [Polyangiaceae bacterium]